MYKPDLTQVTDLNGTRSVRSSTEITLPYHGHIIKICEEYAIKQMRQRTELTMRRPKNGCMSR